MRFTEAVYYLLKNRKIRRKRWLDSFLIKQEEPVLPGIVYTRIYQYSPNEGAPQLLDYKATLQDIHACDWEVAPFVLIPRIIGGVNYV